MQVRLRNVLVVTALLVFWRYFGEPLWIRNWEYFLDKRDWDKALDATVSAMPDLVRAAAVWLDLEGFWGGAFFVLAIWGCFEFVYVIKRKRLNDQSLPPPRDDDPAEPHDLARLSKPQLRDRALALAAQLRAFENDKRHEDLLATLDAPRWRGRTDEQRNADFEAESRKHAQRHMDAQNEFRSRFLAEARAMETQLLRQLGRRRKANVPLLIGQGAYAGPAPASEVGDYLEDLARDL